MKNFIKVMLVIGAVLCVALVSNGKGRTMRSGSREKKPQFTAKQLELPGKKGVCITLRPAGHRQGENIEKNIPRLKSLNASWNYSWGPEYVDEQPADLEFVPMIWGAWSKERMTEILKTVVLPDIQAGRTKKLLGFNEPDKEEQSDMPYEDALELWPELEKMGVPLCSPACANPEGVHDDSDQGVEGTWMRDFVEEADKRGYRLDYIGVHWYGGSSVKEFQEKMRRIYEKYGKRPLLITEFCPADWSAQGRSPSKNKHSPAKVLKFMKAVLPWMEEQDWIAGYAWYSFRIDEAQGTSSALFDKDGELTACGRFYKSVTPDNPQGDQSIKPDPRILAIKKPAEGGWSWFDELDRNGDGNVSLQEWLVWGKRNAQEKGWGFDEEETSINFGGLDDDGDGLLTSEEFYTEDEADELSAPEVNAEWSWFSELDRNENEEVTASEWISWNKQNTKKRGWKFNQEKAEAAFAWRDADEDGILIREELAESEDE